MKGDEAMRKIRTAWLMGVVVFALGWDAQGALTKVKGRVVAADGAPVVEADVAPFWSFADGKMTPFGGGKTDTDGRFDFEAEFYNRPTALVAVDAERKRGGLVTVAPDRSPATALNTLVGGLAGVAMTKASDPIAIKLGPLVRVHGDFSCQELDKKVGWTNVYMMAEPGKIRVAQCMSNDSLFDLKLPAGEYLFNGYGSQVVKQMGKRLDLKADQPDLDLGSIDLKASPLGKMYGKEAPPLHITDARGIGKDMKLTDFKGKWVVLDFWGYWCGPCVGRSLPELMQFWDEYPDDRDKFVFLAFHDKQAKDFDELDAKLVPIVRDTWGGRNLPFPILLDSTGQTVEEYGIQSWPTTILINPEGKVVMGSEETIREHLPKIPITRRIPLALDRQLSLSLGDGMKLDKFADFLARQSHIPIRLDDQALATAGIAKDTLIPLTIRGQVSFRSWLELGLQPLGLVAVPGPEGMVVTTPQPDSTTELSAVQKTVAERIGRKLGEPTTFDFRDKTLAEVASYFEEQTNENFVLDPADRLAHRLDPKTTVSDKADGMPLRDGLKALLAPLGIEAVVRDEVVVLTKPAKP